MPTNQIAAQNIGDLRAEVRQAKQREQDLAREASALPQKIADAARQVVRERAAQARVGGDLLAVASEIDVQEMTAREDVVGVELWAARLYRAETQKRLHEAEEAAAELEIPDAENKHRAAQTALEAATAEEQRTYRAYFGALGKRDEVRRVKKIAMGQIEELEGQYPGV